jgi:hypothetical protein
VGMYTEFFIKCRISGDAPENVIGILTNLFTEEEVIYTVPDHPFFKCERWHYIGNGGSHYFSPNSNSSFVYNQIANCFFLCSRSDFKNYDNEIGKFLDWIKPHIDDNVGTFIGYSHYEEDPKPRAIYVGDF